jgi:5'-nucleotidase
MLKRILVTNDDGIHAPGIALLERIARQLSSDVWVVAPETEQSAASHSLTVHNPVRLKKYDEKRYSVTGTPTDCVLMAKNIVMSKDSPPTLVLSGINRGSNVGDDIGYSGTVAGAMEACVLGIPAIALSQFFDDVEDVYWGTAEHFAADIIKKLCTTGWPSASFINLNFPACAPDKVKGINCAPQGKRDHAVNIHLKSDPKSKPYYWIGGDRDNAAPAHTDIHALEQGYITITPLHLDWTDYKTLTKMQEVFE